MYTALKRVMVRMRWYLIGSPLLFFSCHSNPNQLEVLSEPLLKGNLDPILLDLERTAIPMAKYIFDPLRLDSITTDGPFAYEIDNSVLMLYGRPKKPAYHINFWYGGLRETILLNRTKKLLYSFFYNQKANGVKVIGDFNEWDANSTILDKKGNAFTDYVLLSPGTYTYRFVVDGQELLDPLNKDSARDDQGIWSSRITIPGVNKAKLPILTFETASHSTLYIKAVRNPVEEIHAFWNNTKLPDHYVVEGEDFIEVSVPKNAESREHSQIRVWAVNSEGLGEELNVSLQFGKVIAAPKPQ